MPDLTFQVRKAAATPFAAAPSLSLEIVVRNDRPTQTIHGVALRCQVRIEAQRRRYSAEEEAALYDLFGEPRQWERSLRPLLWAHASVMVPAFVDEATVELPLPCTYDFMAASARYFHALHDGEAPLLLLFSGTVFHAEGGNALQIAPVPWTKEARYSLPVQVHREVMDLHFPNSAPLLLRRDLFDRLHRHRSRHGFSTWEQALDALLRPSDGAGAG